MADSAIEIEVNRWLHWEIGKEEVNSIPIVSIMQYIDHKEDDEVVTQNNVVSEKIRRNVLSCVCCLTGVDYSEREVTRRILI